MLKFGMGNPSTYWSTRCGLMCYSGMKVRSLRMQWGLSCRKTRELLIFIILITFVILHPCTKCLFYKNIIRWINLKPNCTAPLLVQVSNYRSLISKVTTHSMYCVYLTSITLVYHTYSMYKGTLFTSESAVSQNKTLHSLLMLSDE